MAHRDDSDTVCTHLSHARKAQLATSHSDSMTTSRTVPGQMVISVLRTNLVLKLIRLSAPILLEDASVNRRLCSSITLPRTNQPQRLFSEGARCLKVGLHKQQDLPEAFHERSILASLAGTPEDFHSPRKK